MLAISPPCTVVAKPAEDTPLTALALVKLSEEAGVPPGVINIVTASRERGIEVVAAWLRDGRVRKITFTGSTAVGKHLARESADTLKKISLELGGNAARGATVMAGSAESKNLVTAAKDRVTGDYMHTKYLCQGGLM